MSAGIDYGMGISNVDKSNGIRYGVISQNSILQAWADSAEPDYGEPTCPKCGNAVKDAATAGAGDDTWPHYREHGCEDYACESCEMYLDSQDAFGDEPQGWNYSGDGYDLTDCLDSDVLVLKSDYYTFAQFCSPCVPGAGNLDSDDPDGVKTYCLGHDWFEEGKAPYPVYRVDDDSLVEPVAIGEPRVDFVNNRSE